MNTNQPIIILSAKQVGEVYLDRLVNFFQRGIRPEEALAKVLQALATDVATQREVTQEALSEMAKYVHPTTGTGIIADKKARMKRYTDEGERDATELANLQGLTAPSAAQKKRMKEVQDELAKDAANVRQVTESLNADQANYTRWQERYGERLARLKELQADFQSLQDEGPALIAQIKDSEKAEEARKHDEASRLGVGTGQAAEDMLAVLRSKAEEAGRYEDAGKLLDEELKGEPSLDEELAARDATNAQDDLIADWMNKAKS